MNQSSASGLTKPPPASAYKLTNQTPKTMEVILTIVTIYVIGCFFEKSDYDKEKEAKKLPSFTKEEAERYYFNELKSKQK